MNLYRQKRLELPSLAALTSQVWEWGRKRREEEEKEQTQDKLEVGLRGDGGRRWPGKMEQAAQRVLSYRTCTELAECRKASHT